MCAEGNTNGRGVANGTGGSNGMELFDPKFLSSLRTLFFKLRKRRQLRRKGAQQTLAAGHTREFKDHRHYVPGDDYRAVDWRLYARLGRLFIRIFEEIQEYHIHVIVDRSRSMTEPFPEKRVTALRLAAAVAYLGLIAQHRVSLMTLGTECARELPPLKGQGHVHDILRRLAALEFGGETHLTGALRGFRPSRDRRGIVFMVSDLFGRSPEQAEEAVQQATSWPAETHVVQVIHPREAEPDLEGELRLLDVETGEARRIWLTKRDAERYARAFSDFREGVERACLRREIDYMAWPTDRVFEEGFIELLSRGSQLAGA
jgi:uncharacterized protein (DUF58 family)